MACFSLGLLAMLEDLALVVKATSQVMPRETALVNIDSEVKLQGVMNMVCGLAGALPTNVVGSYTLAVIPLNASGKAFYAITAVGSTIIFFVAGGAISSLPVMVPCFLLFWVGLEVSELT
jgi:MFS superfamily sulfate permease-like transporter